MFLRLEVCLVLFLWPIVESCRQELFSDNGTIEFRNQADSSECFWFLNFDSNKFRSILLKFRQFSFSFENDRLTVGETIPDVSFYNSKIETFRGEKLPENLFVPISKNHKVSSIWIQFYREEKTSISSTFILDFLFLVESSKSKLVFITTNFHLIEIDFSLVSTSKIATNINRR